MNTHTRNEEGNLVDVINFVGNVIKARHETLKSLLAHTFKGLLAALCLTPGILKFL
jgi:hypothetical protein